MANTDSNFGQENLDREGYLTISKEGVEAKIVPTSFPVWDELGWKVKQTKGAAKAVQSKES